MKINPLAARPKRTLMLHPFTKVYQRLEQTATGITLYKRESVIIFEEIDEIKREIISLYKDEFYKIDSTGLIVRMYDSVPTQLAADKKIILYLQLPEKENLKG